jgi:hypothetical protein
MKLNKPLPKAVLAKLTAAEQKKLATLQEKSDKTGVLLCRLISPSFLYLSTQRIKLCAEHLNILQTSSCVLSSVK